MIDSTGDAATPQDMNSVDHLRGEEEVTDALPQFSFSTLSDALRAHQIPLENHAAIRRFTSALGITTFVGTSTYIKAVRRDGGPGLHIAHGYTNGFRSRDEAVEASGTASVGVSARGTGQWLVIHPLNSCGTREDRADTRQSAITRPVVSATRSRHHPAAAFATDVVEPSQGRVN